MEVAEWGEGQNQSGLSFPLPCASGAVDQITLLSSWILCAAEWPQGASKWRYVLLSWFWAYPSDLLLLTECSPTELSPDPCPLAFLPWEEREVHFSCSRVRKLCAADLTLQQSLDFDRPRAGEPQHADCLGYFSDKRSFGEKRKQAKK